MTDGPSGWTGVTGFLPSLGITAAVLLAAAAAGVAASRGLFPEGPEFRAERAGWGFLLGLAILGGSEAFCLAVGLPPGPVALLVIGIAAVLLARRFLPRRRARGERSLTESGGSRRGAIERMAVTVSIALTVAGVLRYALLALTEPMWSNDFLAIWGLKGHAIFAAGRLPPWLHDPAIAGFSHPEYPLGLPLVFAAIASLAGRWDDHAMALLFPALQAATLAVLYGWLRRRGASRRLALAAAAVVALFEPLYSAFLTGMAEVPLAAAAVLVGTALSDALDDTDGGAAWRLGAAAFLAATIKNEGLFLAGAAALVAIAASVGRGTAPRGRGLRCAAAAFLPALAAAGLGRWALGPAPLRDLDFGLLAPSRLPELAARFAEAARAEARLAVSPSAWPILACAAVLLVLGRRAPFAGRLVGLAAVGLAAYVTLPALARRGPEWLVQTTLPRTSAALAPLIAAGIAGRYILAPRAARRERWQEEGGRR